MRVRLFTLVPVLLAATLLIVACQGQQRTEFLMEVTVEVTRLVPVTVTPEATTVAVVPTENSTDTGSSEVSVTPEPVASEVTPEPTATPTDAPPTATPDIFPTPIVAEVIVAEQEFENGRMFYLDPRREIWVMTYSDDSQLSGVWTQYNDTWQEGMAEMDSELVPPAENLAQPIRGFGFLWRENPEIRDALGWAVDSEFGHVTTYRYESGGEIVDGEYIRSPGVHLINSRTPGTTYIFDETNGEWSIAADPSVNQ